MTEAVGWSGIVIAIAAMVRGEFAAYTARQTAKEKAESDRQAAKDRMEFEFKAKELELKHALNEDRIREMSARIEACEADRKDLWTRLAAVEKKHEAKP